MEFHIEKLDEDKLKEYKKIIEPHQYVLSMSKNIISNSDQSVLFFCLGGQGSSPEERGFPPTYYCLIFNGTVIPLWGREKTTKSGDSFLCFYSLGGVLIPELLKYSKDRIYMIITQAMTMLHKGVWQINCDAEVNIYEPKYI